MADSPSMVLLYDLALALVIVDAVVVVLASGHVVLTKNDSRAALGWIGIIWLTPILGTVIYFTFGVNRIQRKARRLRTRLGLLDSSRRPRARGRRSAAPGPRRRRPAPGAARQIRLPADHLPLLDGNRVTPLTTGRQAYDEMLAAIDAAKRRSA